MSVTNTNNMVTQVTPSRRQCICPHCGSHLYAVSDVRIMQFCYLCGEQLEFAEDEEKGQEKSSS